MRKNAIVLFAAMVSLATASGTTAQSPPELSGFVDDYPELQPSQEVSGAFIWETELVPMVYYNVLFDQPEIFLHPESKYKGMKPDQMQVLAESLRETVVLKLIDRFPLASMPGPDTVRIRLALTNIHLKKTRGKLWFTPIGAARTALKAALGKNISLREATIEAEVLDSVTNERIAVYVHKIGQRKDKKAGQKRIKTSWDEVYEALEEAGNLARQRMDALQPKQR